MNEYDKKDDRIAYGQAMNLAVQYASMFPLDHFKDANDRMTKIKEAREWFYKELCKVPPRTKAAERPTAPVRSPRSYKSDKQEVFLRGQEEVPGAIETPATLDAIYGFGDQKEYR